jgi:CO/xanthine dehydrogenase Mo-binding subunit
MTEYSLIGKRVPRVDALSKATGQALYSGDISFPNMLHGKVLCSSYAHAMIRHLDISRAQALKGVMVVLTAADIPNKKWSDESRLPFFAREKTVFTGQPVAVVAAINPYIAEEALGLIEIDYEKLPPVLDVLEAMKPDSPLIYPDMCTNLRIRNSIGKGIVPSNISWHVEYGRGDVETGFKESYVVMENTFRTQRVYQGYLEPRTSVASVDANGNVTVWTDNQGLFQVRELCAEFLDIPLSHVKVMPIEVGGAFGAKQSQPLSPLCALIARKTGRPVRMVMTREEDLLACYPAPASTITVKMGVDKEGQIIAVSYTMILEIGALYREVVDCLGSSNTGLSLYRIPNLSVNLYNVVTNKAPTGAYRAPNGPDAAFAVESQMDLLARALQMDPLEFRLKNAVSQADYAADGSQFPKIGFKETLLKMKEHISMRSKLEGKNRGTGVACGLWYPGGGAFAAIINLIADGSVVLIVGSCDLSGTRTSLAQIVAEQFGISLDKVKIVAGGTDIAPYCNQASGSRITRQMSTAVYRACQDAKEQLAQQAASQLGVKPTDLTFANGHIQMVGMPEKSISLAALVRITIGRGGKGPIIGRGSIGSNQSGPIFAVQMADVEVDKETGKVKVLSFAAAQDVGFALNPTLIEGQIQGAVAQGIGRALMEDYVFQKGIIQNPNFLDYRMPTSLDLPFIDVLLVEVKSDIEPFGVRGVGEPPMIPTLATIANAIHSAIGVRLKELPMTPEMVFYAICDQEKLSSKE